MQLVNHVWTEMNYVTYTFRTSIKTDNWTTDLGRYYKWDLFYIYLDRPNILEHKVVEFKDHCE